MSPRICRGEDDDLGLFRHTQIDAELRLNHGTRLRTTDLKEHVRVSIVGMDVIGDAPAEDF